MGTVWTLPEHQDKELGESAFSDEAAEFLLENFASQVDIEFPTVKTDNHWVLRNNGYVGHIQLPDGDGLTLKPRVELNNVFAMMEYAYDLGDFDLDSVYQSSSVEGFYDRIANILAENVIDRRKRGLYRSYVHRSEKSETIRGKINFTKTARKPWDTKAHIEYSEMTADNEHNQILLYTLSKVSSSTNLCRQETLRKARKAIRLMRGEITYKEFRATDCVGRRYNRLNSDYERLHALCRLILDNSGPSYKVGDVKMVPFNVNMHTLYQEFVTKWLQNNLPAEYRVKPEEKVALGTFDGSELFFRIDLVLYDTTTGDPICVIDTKYKDDARPASEDLSQMTGYAKSKDVDETFLLYPSPLADDLDIQVDDIQICNLTFPLDDDLEQNGHDFLEELADAIGQPDITV